MVSRLAHNSPQHMLVQFLLKEQVIQLHHVVLCWMLIIHIIHPGAPLQLSVHQAGQPTDTKMAPLRSLTSSLRSWAHS